MLGSMEINLYDYEDEIIDFIKSEPELLNQLVKHVEDVEEVVNAIERMRCEEPGNYEYIYLPRIKEVL